MDIESIAKPVTKWAVTVREPALVPQVFQQAFHLMRSGRPGPVLIDLPFDVQMAEIEFDIDTYEPLPVYKPAATRKQIDKALDMLMASSKPLIVAGGGIINADASPLLVELAELTGVPVIPTLMGWGTIPDDHPLMAGMCGLQTSHRYGNATMLAKDKALVCFCHASKFALLDGAAVLAGPATRALPAMPLALATAAVLCACVMVVISAALAIARSEPLILLLGVLAVGFAIWLPFFLATGNGRPDLGMAFLAARLVFAVATFAGTWLYLNHRIRRATARRGLRWCCTARPPQTPAGQSGHATGAQT